VVFSAGNTGPGTDSLNPYSVAPWVISTGATDNLGRLASFSSRGDFGSPLFHPTIVAPAVNTVSLRASTVATVTTVDGAAANDSSLSSSELPYYTTGSGTSFSAPQVAGVIALMLEANPNLTPAQVRDILQRTATPLPPYYMYEVGAGMLNAQAAVLEAAFSQRRFGGWRGAAYQGQVDFVNSAQTFSGNAAPGAASDSSLKIPANTLLASVQVAWGDMLNPTNLNLTLLDANGTQQAISNQPNAAGLTGHRERTLVNAPATGTWKARVETVASSSVGTTMANTASQPGSQSYAGVLRTTSTSYPALTDLISVDSSSISEIDQAFRSLVMSPIGSHFRPTFAVTRANLAASLVQGARVPQYLPGQSSYTDISDRSTMLFVESAQASPNGSLFPLISTGGPFQPDAAVDRLTAVVALVRAAGLRQQAETGTYTLSYTDAASIPTSLRGYVAVAVQNGLLRTSGTTFNPQGSFTRMDLAHAMARIAAMAQ
jgi:serine protease AprX